MRRIVALGTLAFLLSLATQGTTADKPLVFDVWPGKAPGETGAIGEERSIAPKLPPAFRQLAFDTHARFDRIAVEAEKSDRTLVFTQVSELLSNCVGCHSSYAMRMK